MIIIVQRAIVLQILILLLYFTINGARHTFLALIKPIFYATRAERKDFSIFVLIVSNIFTKIVIFLINGAENFAKMALLLAESHILWTIVYFSAPHSTINKTKTFIFTP